MAPSPIPPVSGAWRVGDPPGHRQFFTLPAGRKLALDNGVVLSDVTVAFETWGTLNSEASNAVLLCHAWTGDSHVSGPATDGHPTPGWWEGVVGPGLDVDTNEWFVVCANVLGGCQGSTGPASPHPDDGLPYGSRFPVITIRDMVRAQARLADHLGIAVWHSVIGGSMGGMQALEWAVTFPERLRSVAPVATCVQASAQQIAWGAIGRRAIRNDPRWNGGDYYDALPGEGPHEGLATARMVAQVTFRSDNAFTDRFGRDMVGVDSGSMKSLENQFEVERYLEYHGMKLVRRFDANSYMTIGKAMDLHDVSRGRTSLAAAMKRVCVPTLTLGIWSDFLYPEYQQLQIRDMVSSNGVRTTHIEIDSPHGHDAFLIDLDQVGPPIKNFLESVD
jgi:homoserine O-acetyltransferase